MTKNDVIELRRMIEAETRPAWKVKRLKEWANGKRGLSPRIRKVIMQLDDELPPEVAWAKIEVILDMLETEDEEA